MGETLQTPTQRPGFFMALTLGPDGTPDEAACAFIGAHLMLWAGVVFNTIVARNFPIAEFGAAEATLVCLYQAFRAGSNRWGKS